MKVAICTKALPSDVFEDYKKALASNMDTLIQEDLQDPEARVEATSLALNLALRRTCLLNAKELVEGTGLPEGLSLSQIRYKIEYEFYARLIVTLASNPEASGQIREYMEYAHEAYLSYHGRWAHGRSDKFNNWIITGLSFYAETDYGRFHPAILLAVCNEEMPGAIAVNNIYLDKEIEL